MWGTVQGMKIKTLCVALMASVLLVGCQTAPPPKLLHDIAQGATAIGSTEWLRTHPQDRPQFVLTRSSLNVLISTGSGTPDDLARALTNLPIREFQGTNGQLIVDTAVEILDVAGKRIVALGGTNVWNGYVYPVSTGVRDGLNQVLGP